MFEEFKTLRRWVEDGDGGAVFAQYHQIDWFIRTHRDELVKSRTFFPGTGNRPTMVNAAFSKVVERILKREAVERA